MKRPILGIIAVFCSQFAFIGYNFLEQAIDISLIKPVAEAEQPLSTLDSMTDTIEVVRTCSPDAEIREKKREFVEWPTPVVRKAVFVKRKNRVEQKFDIAALQKPVLIKYRKSDPFVFKSQTDRPDTLRDQTAILREKRSLTPNERRKQDRTATSVDKDSVPREKRSLFAKALPVIKKPFDWIKAISQKLN
ncbi:MAG: hypothetical protein WBO10_14455 [Pyrinomonadaceae bacterium]